MTDLTLLAVVGARPQFVKAAAVLRALTRRPEFGRLRHLLVHTGQHYDDGMSGVFFRDLGLPEPDFHLGVGSGPHGAQTGLMLARLEEVFRAVRPGYVVVYGDTNSTLAAALAAAKLLIPVVHVEAGLRSFNRAMPEEVNRVLVDHVSTLLFCPTRNAVEHLSREGITKGVHLSGDVMHESALHFGAREDAAPDVLQRLGLAPGAFALATVHRAENTDDLRRFAEIVRALERIGQSCQVVWPMHPRSRLAAAAAGIDVGGSTPDAAGPVRALEPLPYGDMLRLERHARVILTDSGGVQREAHWFGVPCVTLRGETEWPETMDADANRLAGSGMSDIVAAFEAAIQHGRSRLHERAEPAADRIVEVLLNHARRLDPPGRP